MSLSLASHLSSDKGSCYCSSSSSPSPSSSSSSSLLVAAAHLFSSLFYLSWSLVTGPSLSPWDWTWWKKKMAKIGRPTGTGWRGPKYFFILWWVQDNKWCTSQSDRSVAENIMNCQPSRRARGGWRRPFDTTAEREGKIHCLRHCLLSHRLYINSPCPMASVYALVCVCVCVVVWAKLHYTWIVNWFRHTPSSLLQSA